MLITFKTPHTWWSLCSLLRVKWCCYSPISDVTVKYDIQMVWCVVLVSFSLLFRRSCLEVCLLTSVFFFNEFKCSSTFYRKILWKSQFCLDQRRPGSGAAPCMDTRKVAQYLSVQKETIPAFINSSILWMSALMRAVFLHMQHHSSVCMCEAVVTHNCVCCVLLSLLGFFKKNLFYSWDNFTFKFWFSEWMRCLPKVLLCFSEL